jgi:protein-S-isoprenylcysteine O-methyltransferase Ste14
VSDLLLGQLLAVAILTGTIAWASVVGASYGKRGKRAPIAARKPAWWVEVLWPAGTFVTQVWSIGVLVAPGWFYAWPAGRLLPGDHAIQVTGFGLWLLGAVLVGLAGRALRGYMTPEIRVEEGHRLVREGPYRRIRHPTYTAIVTMAVGIGLAFLHPVVLVLSAILAGAANHRAKLEEDLLSSPEAFGAEYTAYMERTGRFLPRWRR